MLPVLINNTDLISLGEKIRVQRKKQGLTQSQLAEAACISDSTVQRLEGAQVKATADTLFQLAKALNVTPNDLSPDHYGFNALRYPSPLAEHKFSLLSEQNKVLAITLFNAVVDGLLIQQT